MSRGTEVYLDANSGAPLSLAAQRALGSALRLDSALSDSSPGSGQCALLPNPSSIHTYGRSAARFLRQTREAVAGSLGNSRNSSHVFFTSSGTEANQMVIRSVLEPALPGFAHGIASERPHWILSSVEHDSVLQLTDWFREAGGEVDLLPVDSSGRPLAGEISRLKRPGTLLVSCIWVNNETGVITDVESLAAETRALGLKLHLDAAQAWGKLTVDAATTGADFLTFSGHKIGGLSGVGAVWAARPADLRPLMPGKQEGGKRGGTENLLGLIALGAAAGELSPEKWATTVAPLRLELENAILRRIPGARVNGRNAPRIANTCSLSFEGVRRPGLVAALDLAGYAVSSGSACSSGATQPSHVLLAMGLDDAEARSSIRVSLTADTTGAELEGFLNALEDCVRRARGD